MPKLFITVNWYIYSSSIYLKHKKYATLNNSLRNHTTGCSTKRSSNCSIILCILQKEACVMMSWIIFCLWEFFMRCRGNKITVKFLNFITFQVFHDLYELSTKHKFSSYLNHHLHKLSSVDWPVLSRYHRYLLWTGWKSCQRKKNSVHLIMVQEMVQIIYFKISPWQSVTSFRI